MKEKYYVIINNGDGYSTAEEITKEELTMRLNDSYYGSVKFLSKMPDEIDINYWGEVGEETSSILIIKGNIVTPKATETVVEYDIE